MTIQWGWQQNLEAERGKNYKMQEQSGVFWNSIMQGKYAKQNMTRKSFRTAKCNSTGN